MSAVIAETPHAPPAGTVLAGKYRVERVIGHGGMGLVLAAMHLHLEHRVAIKLLLPELSHDLEFLARFLREGRAAVKIRSEHVARVLDVGTLDDGGPFMVLEYLEGRDLGDVILAGGPLPIERAVDLLLQGCEALAEAHDLGIVHRDLKPSNFFLTARPDGTDCIKLLDFGISKVEGSGGPLTQHARTRTKASLGSPAYMSPEQLKSSRDVNPRTDIWALGISLHELLTGDLPFQGDSVAELTGAALHVPPSPLRAKRRDAPADLEAVVARCLEKNREDRFPTVAVLASVLAPFGSASARASAERITRIQRGSRKSAPSISDSGPHASAPRTIQMPHAPTVPMAARTDPAWNRSARSAPAPSTGPLLLISAIVFVIAVVLIVGAVSMKRTVKSAAAEPAPAVTQLPASLPTASTTAATPALTNEPTTASAPSPSASASAATSATPFHPKDPTRRPARQPVSIPKPSAVPLGMTPKRE